MSRACYRLGAIGGLTDHLEIWFAVDEKFQPLAHGFMVLYQQYAETFRHGCPIGVGRWSRGVGWQLRQLSW